MEKLKYKQVLDYFMFILYLKTSDKKNEDISANYINSLVGYEADFSQLKDMVKYLEARGYVYADYTYGDISVRITSKGIIYLEEKDSKTLDTFNVFLNERIQNLKKENKKLKEENDLLQSKITLAGEIQNLLEVIKKEDVKDKYEDFIDDLKILRIELLKEFPDKEILAIKANNLLVNDKYRNKIMEIIPKLNID